MVVFLCSFSALFSAAGGETIYNGFPWPEAAKGTRLQAHPFLRKNEPHPGLRQPDLSYQRGILKPKKSKQSAGALVPPQRLH
jgi:hypothetical protein